MPSISSYPLDDYAALDAVAASELRDRQVAIEQRWAYYHKKHRQPLKVRMGQTNDNVILNMTREVIDQTVAMLFGKPPEFELDEAQETPQEAALEVLWKENKLPLWCQDLGVTGSICGHVFVKLVPTDTSVRFVRLNPKYVTMFWREDDFEKILAYRIQWTAGDDLIRQDLIDQGAGWMIRNLRLPRGKKEWVLDGEGYWPWSWGPIVDWKNLPDPEGCYGTSDLVNPELNDSANFVASNTARILRFHAQPRTIGTGVRADEIKETAVDGLWTVSNPSASIQNLEMRSDLGSSAAFLDFLLNQFYSEHKAVNIASMKDRLGQLTNFGLRTLFQAALDKLATKRSLYGAGLEEVSRRGLLLLGHGNWPITVSWGDPLPYDRLSQIQALQLERDLGVLSAKTASTDLGRDWEKERERIAQEQVDTGNIGDRLLKAFEQGTDVPGTDENPVGGPLA